MRREYYNFIEYDNDLNVLFAGAQKCEALHKWEGMRNHFLVHYIVSGCGRFIVNGNENSLESGSAFIVYPSQKIFYQADEKDPWTYMWAGFFGKKGRLLLEKTGFLESDQIFRGAFCPEIKNTLDDLITTLKTKKTGFEIRAEGLLYLFFSGIAEKIQKKSLRNYSRCEQYTEKLKRFIECNYQRAISVDLMADYLFLNRSYLSTMFKKNTGMSPQEYLVHIRMQHARELLGRTGLSVAEIGQSVGYADYYNFEKMFKKKTGTSPGIFRKERKNTLFSEKC